MPQRERPRPSGYVAVRGDGGSGVSFFLRRRRLDMDSIKCAPRLRLEPSPSSDVGSNDNAAAFTQYLRQGIRSIAAKKGGQGHEHSCATTTVRTI